MKREKHLETIVILVLALIVLYWKQRSGYYLLAAVILGLTGVFIPIVAEKIHWAWMKLGHLMGAVVSKVMLTLIYVVFLLPLSFLSRIIGKKNRTMLKKNEGSYFIQRNFTYTKESMENVW